MDATLPDERVTRPGNPRWGVVLRVAFFIATVIIAARLWPWLLDSIFGVVVAGTIGLFATGMTANWLTMRIFDRRQIADAGLRAGPAAAWNFGAGVLLAGGAAAVMLAIPLLARAGHLAPRLSGGFSWPSLIFYLAALVFGAAGEELMFHGYAFQLLIQKLGPFATVLPAGVLFGFAHGVNPHSTALSILNTALWGIVLGFAFLRSHDLWLPIGLHYGWNAVLPLFGVNLSGLTIDVTRYVYRWDLSPLWSGGEYGPEGGLLTTIFVILLFLAVIKTPVKPQIAVIATVLNDEF